MNSVETMPTQIKAAEMKRLAECGNWFGEFRTEKALWKKWGPYFSGVTCFLDDSKSRDVIKAILNDK